MSAAPEQKRPASKRFRVEMAIVAVLVVIAAGFGIALLVGSDDDQSDAKPDATSEGSAGNPAKISDDGGVSLVGPIGDLSRRVDGDPMAIGDVDAPLVLVEYSDYRCPFCAKFSRDSEPELIERYVDEGKLRIEWRDMPIFGEQSLTAARAGRAAAEQGMFWEFNAAAYEAAPDRGHADLTPAVLRGFAEQVGIPDLDQFDRDAASTEFDESIQSDAESGQAIGFMSTPSFSVNGHPMIGAQPTRAFTHLIDQLLEP